MGQHFFDLVIFYLVLRLTSRGRTFVVIVQASISVDTLIRTALDLIGMTRTSFTNRSLSSQSTEIAMYRILLMRSPLRSGLLALIYKHVPRASMEVALS